MAKKGQVQLQSEINTDDEWEKFVKKKGLLVIDVYSDWCGPCNAMVGALKKLKLEVGGDNLQLAIAKSDSVTCLERFRNKSEPTWMFIAGGGILGLMFGANAPKLSQMIMDELEKELRVLEGKETRTTIGFTDLTPLEQERVDAESAIREEYERREAEALAKEMAKRRLRSTQNLANNTKPFGLFLFWPQVFSDAMSSIMDALDKENLYAYRNEKPTLSAEQIENIFHYSDYKPQGDALADLMKGPCFSILVKFTDDLMGDTVVDKCLRAAYGEDKKPPGAEDSPARKLIARKTEETYDDAIPRLWVPPNDLAKASAMRVLFRAICEPLIEPEPEPIPPHVAIVFDVYKKNDVMEMMVEYPENVLRVGFFSSGDPKRAECLAKTTEQWEKRAELPKIGDKMVIQLSKKTSEALLSFLTLGPTYVSPTTVEGKEDCKLFFPEGYDKQPEDETAGTKEKKRRRKRGSKISVTEAPSAESLLEDISAENDEEAADKSDEIPEASDESESLEPIEADKATSPMED